MGRRSRSHDIEKEGQESLHRRDIGRSHYTNVKLLGL